MATKVYLDVILDKMAKHPAIAKEAEKVARKVFEPAKKEMLAELEGHVVSQEIMNGPGSDNISGTLSGKGDLASFIGFPKGDTPVQKFLDYLKNTVNFGRKTKVTKSSRKSLIFRFNVEIPSKEAIAEATPVPWATGRSWVFAISQGLSGLGYYISLQGIHDRRTKTGKSLAKSIIKKSRSGEALQINIKGGRPGRFQNTPYFERILNNFKRRLGGVND
jgi:hypothetical protein